MTIKLKCFHSLAMHIMSAWKKFQSLIINFVEIALLQARSTFWPLLLPPFCLQCIFDWKTKIFHWRSVISIFCLSLERISLKLTKFCPLGVYPLNSKNPHQLSCLIDYTPEQIVLFLSKFPLFFAVLVEHHQSYCQKKTDAR